MKTHAIQQLQCKCFSCWNQEFLSFTTTHDMLLGYCAVPCTVTKLSVSMIHIQHCRCYKALDVKWCTNKTVILTGKCNDTVVAYFRYHSHVCTEWLLQTSITLGSYRPQFQPRYSLTGASCNSVQLEQTVSLLIKCRRRLGINKHTSTYQLHGEDLLEWLLWDNDVRHCLQNVCKTPFTKFYLPLFIGGYDSEDVIMVFTAL